MDKRCSSHDKASHNNQLPGEVPINRPRECVSTSFAQASRVTGVSISHSGHSEVQVTQAPTSPTSSGGHLDADPPGAPRKEQAVSSEHHSSPPSPASRQCPASWGRAGCSRQGMGPASIGIPSQRDAVVHVHENVTGGKTRADQSKCRFLFFFFSFLTKQHRRAYNSSVSEPLSGGL